jgi:pyridoxamine 5'-phosphate oxidase
MTDLSALRENYTKQQLDESTVNKDPFLQFRSWIDEALGSKLREPNAMVLATADTHGRPSARTVLLKGFDAQGFVFFTNYESRKGRDLEENPFAALLFTWLELERQIRIEGRIERVRMEVSRAYFHRRPKASQIGAWASPQSRVIDSRKSLETQEQALQAKYADVDTLPLPPFWGGFCLVPDSMEFWQGRPSRLHDRVRYRLEDGIWKIERLAP